MVLAPEGSLTVTGASPCHSRVSLLLSMVLLSPKLHNLYPPQCSPQNRGGTSLPYHKHTRDLDYDP